MSPRIALASLIVAAGLVACHLLVGTEDRAVGSAPVDGGGTLDASIPRDASPDGPTDDQSDPRDAPIDADRDAGACDLERPFGSPTPINAVNSVGGEFTATLSQDELEIFVTTTTGSSGTAAVHRSVRAAIGAPFAPLARIPELDVPEPHWGVSLSPDGLVLLVSAGARPRFIHRAVRPTPLAPFAPSEPLAFLDAAEGKSFDTPYFGGRGSLYLSRESGPHFDLFFAFTDGGAYSAPRGLAAFNTAGQSEDWPVESLDGQTLFFSSGGLAGTEIVEARRPSPGEPYGTGKTLSFPQSAQKHAAWLSPDGCRLYLVMENAPGGIGGADIFMATRGR